MYVPTRLDLPGRLPYALGMSSRYSSDVDQSAEQTFEDES